MLHPRAAERTNSTFLNGVTPQGLSSCSGWPDITKRPAGSDCTRT